MHYGEALNYARNAFQAAYASLQWLRAGFTLRIPRSSPLLSHRTYQQA